MKEVALSEVKDHLSKYLRLAEEETVIITRHGKPAGILVGFANEDDWFDYRLEHDERFLMRVSRARESLGAGRGKRLEDIEIDEPGIQQPKMHPDKVDQSDV
jgi:prevent-host-death family protein